jgi:Iap family predicted aminopeptidase
MKFENCTAIVVSEDGEKREIALTDVLFDMPRSAPTLSPIPDGSITFSAEMQISDDTRLMLNRIMLLLAMQRHFRN